MTLFYLGFLPMKISSHAQLLTILRFASNIVQLLVNFVHLLYTPYIFLENIFPLYFPALFAFISITSTYVVINCTSHYIFTITYSYNYFSATQFYLPKELTTKIFNSYHYFYILFLWGGKIISHISSRLRKCKGILNVVIKVCVWQK